MDKKRIIVNVEGDLPIRCRVFLKINGKDFVIFSDEKDNSFEIENDTGIVEIEIKKENRENHISFIQQMLHIQLLK